MRKGEGAEESRRRREMKKGVFGCGTAQSNEKLAEIQINFSPENCFELEFVENLFIFFALASSSCWLPSHLPFTLFLSHSFHVVFPSEGNIFKHLITSVAETLFFATASTGPPAEASCSVSWRPTPSFKLKIY